MGGFVQPGSCFPQQHAGCPRSRTVTAGFGVAQQPQALHRQILAIIWRFTKLSALTLTDQNGG